MQQRWMGHYDVENSRFLLVGKLEEMKEFVY